MGTSVLTPTFRYHPVIVAQAFATLGCLFPDRVILGMGTGESMNEVTLGIEWPDGKERFARFREAVKLIRQVWSEERVSFEGEYYRTDKVTIYDRPENPVPIYLGRIRPGRYPVRRARRATATSPRRARMPSCTPRRCCRPCARARARPSARSRTST